MIRLLRRLRGLLFVIGVVAGVGVAPAARVAACDCAMTDLPQAIRDAEVAFVGVLAGEGEAGEPNAAGPGGVAELTWTWEVEWSRDPISADRISVAAWPDDGANCGVAFATGERWLVLGHVEEGRLLTNGCMRNQRMDGTDPEGEAVIASLVTYSVVPRGESASGGEVSLSMPVVLLLLGAAALALVSVVAFRRGAR